MAKVIKASGNEVEPYWPSLFAKALKGTNVEDLLSNIGSAPVAAAAGAPVVASTTATAAPAKGNNQHIFTSLLIVSLQRRKRRKKKKLMSIWVVSSVMITEQCSKPTKAKS